MENKMFPEIQRFLDLQGVTLQGTPKYRLVWSDNEFELRIGTYNEFSGDIFLREVTGAQRVRKYPFARERWILEKFFPPEIAFDEKLPESKGGSYEPLFVFQDKHFNMLPVTLKVVEILIAFDRKYTGSTIQKGCEDNTFAELVETREYNDLLDSIDTSPIMSLLHTKEAIVRP